jgi:hypothetical protein
VPIVSEGLRLRVEELLGRPPLSEYRVVVVTADGDPLVIANAPFLLDGTPLPTMYWLLGGEISNLVGTLEAQGGVRRAQSELDADAIQQTHRDHEALRNAQIAALDLDPESPRPTGGVAGTRVGVKCLHAHLANFLASGNDVVGEWTAREIGLASTQWRRVDGDKPADSSQQ